MKTALTTEDFIKAAKLLNCEPAAIAAVARVESGKYGCFYADGFPIILFERHKFYKNLPASLKAQVRADHPELCGPSPYGRGEYGTVAQQRVKFSQAFRIDEEAAMMACSWGAFQELGENYDDYGFKAVGEFVDVMKSGADGQLSIFLKSIIRRGLADELRRHDWAGFARNYNGPSYRRNEYDTRFADAYRRAVKEFAARDLRKVTDAELEAAVQPVPLPASVQTAPASEQVPNSSGPAAVQSEPAQQQMTELVAETVVVVDAPAKENSTATATKLVVAGFTVPAALQGAVSAMQSAMTNGFISPAEVGGAVLTFVRENTRFVFYGLGLILLGILLKKFYKQATFWLQCWFAASKEHNSIEVRKQ